ncbi:MAG: rRNA maturation RNase YbeY [Nitrospirota bacterium]
MLKIAILQLNKKKLKTNWQRGKPLKQIIKQTLKYEGVLNGELSVVLGDDELLKRLNKEYRKIDKPTDVLAFEGNYRTYRTHKTYNLIGEVIISIDAVRRQAEEYNHSFEKELTILLIHGLLHLLGYDHSPDNLPQEQMAIRTLDLLDLLDLWKENND